MNAQPPVRSRDRETTEKLLVAAARDVLAEVGFQGLGINAVARRAGCDKQLIYRYFGGLEGLVDAIGDEIARTLRQRLGPLAAVGSPDSYRELVERMLLGLLQTLRDDQLMQKIVVWEMAEASPLVARLVAARSKSMTAWVMEMRGTLVAPDGVDAPGVNALLIAGVQHMVIAATASGQFSGMPLRADSDWERLRDTIKAMVRAIYPAA